MSAPRSNLVPLVQTYERPTQQWVCGHAAAGEPCPFGPTPQGTCRTTSECAPRRQGSRWHCSRPEARGGPCPEGPLPEGQCAQAIPPCQPVRSIRARRGVVVFLAIAGSLGVMLWLLDGPAGWQFQEPGPLTFQHGTVTHSCEACHAIPLEKPAALFASALHAHDAHVQNDLCLNCHDLGGQAALPHGLTVPEMARLRREAQARPAGGAPLVLAAARKLGGVPAADGLLSCGSCHREHQGTKFDLRAMDNQRCQTCHTQQFASLAHGHPEFRDYPLKQRPPIAFDHEAHLGRHFKDFHAQMPHGVAPQACMDCHAPDGRQQMMLARSFDQACASCHLPQILDTTLGGVPVLNLPGLDVDTLRRYEQQSAAVEPLTALSALPLPTPTLLPVVAGLFRDRRLVVQPPFTVGEWPAAAAGEPAAIMELLLATNPDFVAARAALRGVDLRDLRRATPPQIAAVGVLVWNIKGLFFDVIRDGDRALTQRLAKLTTPPPTQEQLTLLVADLPASGLWLAQQRWLPALLTEVPNHRAGLPLTSKAALPLTPPSLPPPPGRWRINDDDCTWHYLPRRHTDLFLQYWLDLAGRQYANARQPAFATLFDQLSSPYSPGRCGKCHTVDAPPDGRRIVRWFAAAPQPNAHPFTYFVHGPHFGLVGGRQCQHCHVLQSGNPVPPVAAPPSFVSNFKSMSKSICAECHVAGKAADQCTTCHNYHIGAFSPFRMPISTFADLEKPAAKLPPR